MAAVVESLHHAVTAVRRVVVVKVSNPAQPEQVQHQVNMSVVVAVVGMSQQRAPEKEVALRNMFLKDVDLPTSHLIG